MIGQYLIDLVDEAGYLPADLGQAADRLGATQDDVDAVLAVLQKFDPPGVCARNLSECLAIQLRELNRFDPAMQALVEHLDLLAKRDVGALRKLCGVDDEDIADMIGEIRRLDPKPGLKFGASRMQTMVPDVYVRPGPDGGWHVELNSDTLPRVLVNQTYYTELSKTIRKDGDKSYFTDCLQNATWLVRALDQRARTILKVATEIVRQQDGFFTHGVAHLRPLNLKAVADAIQMHESTVSRVTANKYMATNRGTFELKYFFTASIASADGGEAHSAEAVRHHIKQLIDAEAPTAILSDDTIVERLRDSGIDIARRTVAKYREAMRIPSSVQRRRDKQSSLWQCVVRTCRDSPDRSKRHSNHCPDFERVAAMHARNRVPVLESITPTLIILVEARHDSSGSREKASAWVKRCVTASAIAPMKSCANISTAIIPATSRCPRTASASGQIARCIWIPA